MMAKKHRTGWRDVTIQLTTPNDGKSINGWAVPETDARPVKNLNGKPSRDIRADAPAAFFKDTQGFWRRTDTRIDLDLDDLCARTHGHIRQSILTQGEQNVFKDKIPDWVQMAGLEPESRVSRQKFETLLNGSGPDEFLHRFLYLHDVSGLVTNIQRSSSQLYQTTGAFYGVLNDSEFWYYQDDEKVGLRSVTSGDGNILHLHLETAFVRMRSMLDYAVKLALEAERKNIDFSTYPKLKGASKQFSDRKHLGMNERAGTVFVEDEPIREIMSIRDRVIHDGHLDIDARVYESFKRQRLVERFVLLPDMTDGKFDVYKNRRNFFGSDDKINLRLPSILDMFYNRMTQTIQAIHDTFALNVRR